jgi:hypothetical protein
MYEGIHGKDRFEAYYGVLRRLDSDPLLHLSAWVGRIRNYFSAIA